MAIWDYTILDCRSFDDTWRPWMIDGHEIANWQNLRVGTYIKELGRKGWELVSIGHSGDKEYWVFKRLV
jgi:hypothetical protein